MAGAKRKPAATPFDALLGTQPMRMPRSSGATLVLEGKIVHTARDIQAENGLWHPDDQALARSEKKRLRAKLDSVQQAAGYQRERQQPQQMQRRATWNETHVEERRAYMAAYRTDPANVERINASKLAWQKRAYAADPEKYRQRALDYYARNREAILARAAIKREAKREAKRQAEREAPAQAAALAPSNPATRERTEP